MVANLNHVLAALVGAQRTSAPIELSIGSVKPSGVVDHDSIIVKEAPPSVVKRLQEFSPSLTKDGLQIHGFWQEAAR